MKTARRLLIMLAIVSAVMRSQAQGSAFTYQGRLDGTSGPATGTYDFQFTLYNSISGGVVVMDRVTNSAVRIVDDLRCCVLLREWDALLDKVDTTR